MKKAELVVRNIVLALIVGICIVSTAYAKGKPTGGQDLPWGVDRIDADKAWDSGNKGAGIRVAVIDTGIDKTHPDLVGKTEGINFVGADWPGDQNFDDINGHGTHIAGIIAANDNKIGVVGVAPEVTLYSVKVREGSGIVYPDGYPDHGGTYNFTDLCEGMRWCIDNDIQVINFSLGIWTIKIDQNGVAQRDRPLHDSGFYALIKEAADNHIVMVAAAGNQQRRIQKFFNPPPDEDYVDDAEPPIYDFPASYNECIAISATDMKTTGKPSERGDSPASFTSYGPAIEISAPGASIYSTTINGGYSTGGGTSYAAPHVAGVAALILASGVLPENVKQALIDSAEDLGPEGLDEYYGHGLVDAGYAIAEQRAPARPNIASPVGKLSATWGEIKGR